MRKVALFSDGWKRLITYAWVEGMMKYISRFKEEVIAQLGKDDISVSIGQALTDPMSDRIFDDYMKVADDEMYKVKVAKKEKGGFRKR